MFLFSLMCVMVFSMLFGASVFLILIDIQQKKKPGEDLFVFSVFFFGCFITSIVFALKC